jgi:hypothetical protein
MVEWLSYLCWYVSTIIDLLLVSQTHICIHKTHILFVIGCKNQGMPFVSDNQNEVPHWDKI